MIPSLKQGVKLKGLVPQMAMAHTIVCFVYDSFHAQACVVTSANDSQHGKKTLHHEGRALDFRTKDFAGNKLALRDAIKAALGPDFDVVLEAMGQDSEHLHLEWDPKG